MHSNTKQGKIAEVIVEEFIRRYYNKQLSTLSYDKIRNDRNEKHAPFDLLIWRTGSTDISPIVESIRADISNTRDEFVRLSDATRRLCREAGVKIAEVKSTKIRPSLKETAGFNGDYDDHVEVGRLLDAIMERDDIFCYPHYKREDAAPGYSMEDYCRFVRQCEPSLAMYRGEQLRKKVIDLEVEKQCCDVVIRVYLDTAAKRGYVIGWMSREKLLDYRVRFKHMPQKNKSEKALYLTKKLTEIEPIDRISDLFSV